MMARVTAVALLLAVLLVRLPSSLDALGPIHASCKIQWQWTASCQAVLQTITRQIAVWNGPQGCTNGGEMCLYKLVSQSDTQIKATHETPVKHYVDDLTFSFQQDQNQCVVQGFSTSETWYAVLDYGTNYCNLHNLITGSGLDKQPGYSETTTNDVCTQYTSANCTVY